jgi:hypothetical protein
MAVFGMTPICLCRRGAISASCLPLANYQFVSTSSSVLDPSRETNALQFRSLVNLLAWLAPISTPLLVSTSSPAFASSADRQAVVHLVNL